MDQKEFPVLLTCDERLYWFISVKNYQTLSNDLELLNNLREFFSLNLDEKRLNSIYKIYKRKSNNIGYENIIYYEGQYDVGGACGNMHFGVNLDNDVMVKKIDEYISIHGDKIYKKFE